MTYQRVITVLLLAVMLLTACGIRGENGVDGISLDHLKTPVQLTVQSREVYETVQELANRRLDAFVDVSELDEKERAEMEAFFGQLPAKIAEIEKQMIDITDPEVIEAVFDQIRKESAVYADEEMMKTWREGNFYFVRVSHSSEAINQKGRAMDYPDQIQDGYLFDFTVLENDILFFPDGQFDPDEGPGMLFIPFDFDWFQNRLG